VFKDSGRTTAKHLAVPFLLVFCLACCGSPRRPVIPGVFRYRLASDPPSLDPAHAVDGNSQLITNQVFDGLVRLNPVTLEVEPALAESILVLRPGLEYLFYLRRGVSFHDGSEFDSRAVVFSYRRLLERRTRSERPWVLFPILGAREYRAGKTSDLKGLKVLGPYRLLIRLCGPTPFFLKQLAMESAAIVSPRSAVELGDRFSESPVGTGPFKFVLWRHSDRLVLERNSDYWGPVAGPERIEFTVIPDPAVALEKYLSGEVDFVNEIPPPRLEEMRRSHPAEIRSWPLLEIRYLGFNLDDPVLGGNIYLRRALNYAVNKRAIVDILCGELPRPATGILPPGIRPGGGGEVPYPYNPGKAKELLALAGYPGGEGLPELELWCPDNPLERRIWLFVQAGFRQVGVKVDLRTLEWAAFLAKVRSGKAQMFRGSWIADYPDPHDFLYILLHSSQAGSAGNYARFRNRKFDELVEKAAVEVDPETRMELYRRADSLAVDQAPWVFLYYDAVAVMVRSEWRGYCRSPLGTWASPLELLQCSLR